MNDAVTVVDALRVSTQVPVPVHLPPPQPANRDPTAAAAVRDTPVPGAYDFVQVAPQPMPAGELVTVPVPVPLLVTVSTTAFDVKEAVTAMSAVLSAVTTTTHVPVPLQPPPDHPANVDPDAALAARVTEVPVA
jgi:hypothetical protein